MNYDYTRRNDKKNSTEFEKKYSFSYEDLEEELRPFIAKDIKESLRKAENELQGSTGIDLK